MNIKAQELWIRFNELLDHQGMTQVSLCDKLDINLSTMKHWKRVGAFPPSEDLFKIASLLGTTCEYLLSGYIGASRIEPELMNIINKLNKCDSDTRSKLLGIINNQLDCLIATLT